ncbi:hypothetical protein CRX72_08745 [Pantoea sp. BRM17]|nr:hypothetical protein CRX72_08745 [Pantoea sp. BRM17]
MLIIETLPMLRREIRRWRQAGKRIALVPTMGNLHDGQQLMVLECVPVALAGRITQALTIPVIGIGAGNVTDGQILVMHDAFGITGGHIPKFAKNFLAETGDIRMVKLEGGAWLAESVRMLTERAVPVCGHLGLTPQSVNIFGGYKVQGRDEADAERLLADALALEAAGASYATPEQTFASAAQLMRAGANSPLI